MTKDRSRRFTVCASMQRSSYVSLFLCWIFCTLRLLNVFSQPPPQVIAEISRSVFEELVAEIVDLKEQIMELQKRNEELMSSKQHMEELSDEKQTCHSAATTGLSQYKDTDRPTASDHPIPSDVILYYLGDNDKSFRPDEDSTNKPLHGPKTLHNRYNGETIRTIPTAEGGSTNAGNGISGTDSAAMITMETLAQNHPSRRNNNSLFLYQASHVLDG